MKAIKTEKAPAAIGPYSQAIEVNGFVFASGQIPLNPATGEFVEGGIKEQTRQALNNAREIMRAAGLDLCNVVKTSVMLAAFRRDDVNLTVAVIFTGEGDRLAIR